MTPAYIKCDICGRRVIRRRWNHKYCTSPRCQALADKRSKIRCA